MNTSTTRDGTMHRKPSWLPSCLALPSLAILLGAPAVAQQTVHETACMATRAQADGGYALNCTANDIRIASAEILPGTDGKPVACPYPGAEVSFRAQFTVETTATERFDVGLWFAEDGDPNNDGALTGSCGVSTLPVGPMPFVNIDGVSQPGDSCGDIKKPLSNPLYPVIEVVATCVDYDAPGTPGHGKLDLPYCTSWRQSGSNEFCGSPIQAFPGAPSKCKCDRTFDVPIDVPLAKLRVEKSPDPTSMKEPGGDVTFTLAIYNDAIDPVNAVTLDTLTDAIVNQSGTVITSLGSLFLEDKGSSIKSTTCRDGMVIGAGGSATCSFTLAATGNAGTVIRDLVTVSGLDHYGKRIDGQAGAAVTITDERPDIQVTKSANPAQVTEPGGNVAFTVTVKNVSPAGTRDALAIVSLVDDVHGNLNGKGSCNTGSNLYPAALAYNATYTCQFTAYVAGNGKTKTLETDIVTATVNDSDGFGTYSENSNPVTVTIRPQGSSITVDKRVSYNGGAFVKAVDVPEVPSPGVALNYRVVITNTSTVDEVTITSLTEKVSVDEGAFGNPYALTSSCALPFVLASNGGSRTCTFSLSLYGNNTDSHVNEVTASGVDDDGDAVVAGSSAAVRFTDVPPTAVLTKTAEKALVTYRVKVTNTSTVEELYLTALTDDKFGNVTRAAPANPKIERTDCAAVTIDAGQTYECTFDAYVENGSDATLPHVNEVTATISDDEGTDVTPKPSDTASVDLE